MTVTSSQAIFLNGGENHTDRSALPTVSEHKHEKQFRRRIVPARRPVLRKGDFRYGIIPLSEGIVNRPVFISIHSHTAGNTKATAVESSNSHSFHCTQWIYSVLRNFSFNIQPHIKSACLFTCIAHERAGKSSGFRI